MKQKIVLQETKKSIKVGDECVRGNYPSKGGIYLVNDNVVCVPKGNSKAVLVLMWDGCGVDIKDVVVEDINPSDCVGLSDAPSDTPVLSQEDSISGKMHINYHKEFAKNMLDLATILTREKDK